MNDIEKILNYMFHSKYIFFVASSVAARINLREKRVKEILEAMEKAGVTGKAVPIDDKDRYFLTLPTKWIITHLLQWRS